MMKGCQLPTNSSYLTIIGVHSTMHLVHPNYCQITTICMYSVAWDQHTSRIWHTDIVRVNAVHVHEGLSP